MVTRSQSALQLNEITLPPGTELSSMKKKATQQYYQISRNMELLLNQAEGVPQFFMQNAYMKERSVFKKQVKEVHVSKIPKGSHETTSHVLYKIKTLYDNSLMCKACIALYGGRDKDKNGLRSDSQTCPPPGLRILLSICTIFDWCLFKIDITSAFSQSGSALCDVYADSLRACNNQGLCWLPITATHRLVNANIKWQLHTQWRVFLKSWTRTAIPGAATSLQKAQKYTGNSCCQSSRRCSPGKEYGSAGRSFLADIR